MAKPKYETLNLLLVDDNSINLDILEEFFEDTPEFNTLVAESYDEAVQQLRENAIDYIITDNRMPPGKSGLELIQNLIELQKEHSKRPPIIFCSATEGYSEIRRLCEQNFGEYSPEKQKIVAIKKPFYDVQNLMRDFIEEYKITGRFNPLAEKYRPLFPDIHKQHSLDLYSKNI